MNIARPVICLLIALLFSATLLASAEETGMGLFCDGTIERTAGGTFTYRLALLNGSEKADEAINAAICQLPQMLSADEDVVSVSTLISHCSTRYFSMELVSVIKGGSGEHEKVTAVTFARDGMYAGSQINLTQLLGLEQETGTLNMASETVYDLVWQIVQQEIQNPESDYLDGLTRADLERSFSPETDFVLDADGNAVFLIQAGEIAGDIAGTLRFPFAPAELLSEMR